LDYHQQHTQVCIVDREGQVLANRRCRSQWKAVVSVAEQYGTVQRAALEAGTGSASFAEELVAQARWSVDLAHAGYVRRMKENPDKSDFTDARMLADLERVGYLPRVWLAPAATRELRRLVRYRQQLVAERRNLKLRITAMLRDQRLTGPPRVGRWTVAWLNWLQENDDLSEQGRWIVDRQLARWTGVKAEIQEVESRLAAVTQDDPLVARLQTQSGVGPVTAWTLRAEIGRFDRFVSGKQLARFCGLSPRNASSGARQADAGLIKAGNRQLRATLIEAAQRLLRFDLRWSAYGAKLLRRGKKKCVVVAAVANRWMRCLYHEMQPDQLTA
jgi:transposase